MKLNLIDELKDEEEYIRTFEAETHKHREGKVNATALNHCIFLSACYAAHVDMPKPTGLKADTSALLVGEAFHVDITNKFLSRFKRKQLVDHSATAEVLVEVPVLDDLTISSRIDLAMVQHDPNKPGFNEQEYQYKNESRKAIRKHPDAKWVQIWDIKTSGMFGYYKMQKEGLPISYQIQGEIYMKATGLEEITFLIVNKEKGWKFELIQKHNDAVWNLTKSIAQRRQDLIIAIRDQKSIPLKASDFACVDPDAIDWYSCPLSITEEDEKYTGQPALILKNVCPLGQEFVKVLAKAKFSLNSMWKRGQSIITVLEESETGYLVANKSKKLFEDTFCYALRNYKSLE